MADFIKTYDLSLGNIDVILTQNEKYESIAATQIDVDGTFNGTTSTIEFIQSNDRDLPLTQWHPLPETPLTLIVNDSSLLSTFGYTARFLAVRVIVGDATAGIINITTNFKK